MQNEKLHFLLNTLPNELRKLEANKSPFWGKMNVQQMIEHLSDAVREANGKTPHKIMTDADRLPKMKEFLMSEKEFRPNTKNALMGEEPAPTRNSSLQEAIAELEKELNDFQKYYDANPSAIITNPFFGNLNFDEWLQLLHKHGVHHLKQFGWMQ